VHTRVVVGADQRGPTQLFPKAAPAALHWIGCSGSRWAGSGSGTVRRMVRKLGFVLLVAAVVIVTDLVLSLWFGLDPKASAQIGTAVGVVCTICRQVVVTKREIQQKRGQ
jgi:hypothetical protein